MRWCFAIAFLTSSAAVLAAQSPPVSYVASIKPNNSPDSRAFSEFSPGGRFTATAITVRTLIRNAYRIQDGQIAGAPSWFSDRRWDISAKADDNPAPSQQMLLQALLKDRFHLAAHQETRTLPVFMLVLASKDQRLGHQLVASSFDCARYLAGPHALPEPGRTPNCATNIRSGALSGRAITMTQLATALTPFVGRFTIDKTGLNGGFDVELTWAPQQNAPPQDAPSIFTALEEQLGLKLISDKGPVTALVIDQAQEPAPD